MRKRAYGDHSPNEHSCRCCCHSNLSAGRDSYCCSCRDCDNRSRRDGYDSAGDAYCPADHYRYDPGRPI